MHNYQAHNMFMLNYSTIKTARWQMKQKKDIFATKRKTLNLISKYFIFQIIKFK